MHNLRRQQSNKSMKTTYTTSKPVGLSFLLIGIFSLLIAVWDSPSGFQVDAILLTLIAVTVFGFFDLLWGINVSLSEKTVSRVDNFVFRKEVPLDDIEIIRYQPTYGIGKEVSSLYILRKGHDVACITMTSLWFTERLLREFLRDIKKRNPAIVLDEEARELMDRPDGYFDAQKIQLIPFLVGVVGVLVGIFLFVTSQSTLTEEFSLTNHGVTSLSMGLVAGFGTFTLLRRKSLALVVGILAAFVLLMIYRISTS